MLMLTNANANADNDNDTLAYISMNITYSWKTCNAQRQTNEDKLWQNYSSQ